MKAKAAAQRFGTAPANRMQEAMEETTLTLLIIPAIAIATLIATWIANWWDPVVRARFPGLSFRAFLYAIGAALLLTCRYW